MFQLSRRYRYVKEILIFLLLMAAIGIGLVPARRMIQNSFAGFERTLREQIREHTGLDVSFASASPNIFRRLTFSRVSVADAASGEEILAVDRLSVSFRLLKILRGEFLDSVREITVDGGSLNFDLDGENAVTAWFPQETPEFAERAPPDRPGLSALRGIFNNGVSFRMRNFSFSARAQGHEFGAHVGEAGFFITPDRLTLDSDLHVFWRRPVSGGSLLSSVGADISLSGEISSDLTSGFASLSVGSVALGNISFPRIGLVAGLQDGILSVTSMQEGQPLSVSAVVDRARRTVEASVSCERLLLFRWLSSAGGNRILSDLQNTTLSGTGSLSYTEEDGLRYAADGQVDVSPAVYGGGAVSFRFSGDSRKMEIASLRLDGPEFDAGFSGSFDFTTRLPDGFLSVRNFNLPDGKLFLAGDFRLDADGRRLVCSVPHLRVNRAEFFRVEGTADFSDEKQSEFSLAADDASGHLFCEGVFSRESGGFLQLYGAFDSVNVQNGVGAVPASLLSAETFRSLSGPLAPFALTTEVYFSTDFSRFSYNSPRLIFASSENDGLYLLASVTGTESGTDITDISTSPGGVDIRGNVYALFDSADEILFTSDFSVAGIPYNISGMYAGRMISASGDYGISFTFRLPDAGRGGSGSLFFSGLPVQAGPAVLSFSLDADFARQNSGVWGGNIRSFRAEEITGFTFLDTVLSASGGFDSASGVFLRDVTVSDAHSVLSGFASLGLLSDTVSGLQRVTVDVNMRDVSGEETVLLSGSVTEDASDTLFELQGSVTRFPLMRIHRGQLSDNFLSAEISLSGSPDMMLVSLNVPESSFRVAGADLNLSGLAMYEDGLCFVHGGSASWRNVRVSDLQADFSTETLSGFAGAVCSGVFAGSSFSMDLRADLQGRAGEETQPETAGNPAPEKSGAFGWIRTFRDAARSFSAEIALSGIRWRESRFDGTVLGSVQREPGVTVVYAGEDDAFSGLLLDDGAFTLSLAGNSPVHLQADGSASGGLLDVDVSGVGIDIARLWPVVGHEIVAFDGGRVEGGFHIGGHFTDPDFTGTLNARDIVIRSPDYFPTPFDPASFVFVAEGKEIRAPRFVVTGNGGTLEAEAVCYFNRWIPEQLDLFVRNMDGTQTAAEVNNKYVVAEGDVFCDILFTWVPGRILVSGDAGFQNGSFAIRFDNIGEKDAPPSKFSVEADLTVHMGRKVEFRWPSGTFPIMRALLQADEPFSFTADTATGEYAFKGSAALKGGDFFYFKRSFYLREGRIVFDETQDHFDPRISLRAEVRERDENGNSVRITMRVDDDPLSSFHPVFSSEPLRSQFEIMEILGQVATADTSSDNAWRDLAVAGTDLLTQMGVLRPAENFIRDALGLDAFSVRTLALQNAVFGNSIQGANSSDRWTPGNFLDNTTVYIGKYFGSSLYLDALLQFSYYDSDLYQDRVYKNTMFPAVFGNLLFLPEIGLELDTPFAHIRWGVSPVPDNNSVTLSWRFSY